MKKKIVFPDSLEIHLTAKTEAFVNVWKNGDRYPLRIHNSDKFDHRCWYADILKPRHNLTSRNIAIIKTKLSLAVHRKRCLKSMINHCYFFNTVSQV